MIQIRKNCFETNSSSTHSMVIGMADDFDKWEKGELVFIGDSWMDFATDKTFVTKEEFVVLVKAKQEKSKDKSYVPLEGFKGTFDEEDDEILRDENIFMSMEAFTDYNDERFECDENTFTTPSGEVVKTICYYGMDC